MYRDDYRRGGFVVLPMDDAGGRRTSAAMVGPVLLLIALTTLAPTLGLGSASTIVGGLVAGVAFLAACLAFCRRPDAGPARGVLLASVLYLPAVLAAVLADHLPGLLG
jgi:protoheme IX farnesyltransferase